MSDSNVSINFFFLDQLTISNRYKTVPRVKRLLPSESCEFSKFSDLLQMANVFRELAGQIIKPYSIRGFKSLFGVSLETVNALWNLISGRHEPMHLLWALYFLKVYPTDDVFQAQFKTSKRTLRKHVKNVLVYLYQCFEEEQLVC